jgi:molybdenum cofactor cytidylyltransferase
VVQALILAAGESTRMGSPKACLADPDGRPFVARVVRAFHDAGVVSVIVITGSQHDAIVAALAADHPAHPAQVVRNPDPSRGQLSSLWTGLDAVAPGTAAVLMTLVDVPMLQASTIRAVVESWQNTHAPIVRPAMGDRHGHPVLFDRSTFDDLRRAPLTEGAKAVVHAYADRLINVAVDDTGSLTDIDTPADYQEAMKDRGRSA